MDHCPHGYATDKIHSTYFSKNYPQPLPLEIPVNTTENKCYLYIYLYFYMLICMDRVVPIDRFFYYESRTITIRKTAILLKNNNIIIISG